MKDMKSYLEEELSRRAKEIEENGEFVSSLVTGYHMNGLSKVDFSAVRGFYRLLAETIVLLKLYNANYDDTNKRESQAKLNESLRELENVFGVFDETLANLVNG